MATITETFTITPPLVSIVSVTLTSLTIADTGVSVTMPSPPTFVTAGGGVYTLAFTEPTPGLVYAYRYATLYSNGQTDAGSGVIPGVAPASWYYSNQSDCVNAVGGYNLAEWLNMDNTIPNSTQGHPAIDVGRLQWWGTKSDYWINAQLLWGGLAYPVAQTDPDWSSLNVCSFGWTCATPTWHAG